MPHAGDHFGPHLGSHLGELDNDGALTLETAQSVIEGPAIALGGILVLEDGESVIEVPSVVLTGGDYLVLPDAEVAAEAPSVSLLFLQVPATESRVDGGNIRLGITSYGGLLTGGSLERKIA